MGGGGGGGGGVRVDVKEELIFFVKIKKNNFFWRGVGGGGMGGVRLGRGGWVGGGVG